MKNNRFFLWNFFPSFSLKINLNFVRFSCDFDEKNQRIDDFFDKYLSSVLN